MDKCKACYEIEELKRERPDSSAKSYMLDHLYQWHCTCKEVEND